MIWLTRLFLVLSLATFSHADLERFTFQETNSLTITSLDGSAILHVEIERLDREKLTITEAQEKIIVRQGKRQLPFDVLLHPTMIKKLQLSIDGKNIPIPKNFWNDIGGLLLQKVTVDPKRPIQTPEDSFHLEAFKETSPHRAPTLSRTPGGSTVLISWVRPEE